MKPTFVTQEKCALWLVDMQEKLFPPIQHASEVLETVQFMLKVNQLLQLPLIVTEQTPEKLGPTIASLHPYLHKTTVYPKTAFSGLNDKQVRSAIEETRVKQWILMGLESHTFILQSAKDLLHEGFEVIVLSDGTSACSSHNFLSALDELRQMGARVTTAETIVYELLADANHKDYPTILEWIREKNSACISASSSSSR